MNLYSMREAGTIFGRDHKTIAKHARSHEADGELVLSRGRAVLMLDDAGMDVLARRYGQPRWRARAKKSRGGLLASA